MNKTLIYTIIEMNHIIYPNTYTPLLLLIYIIIILDLEIT